MNNRVRLNRLKKLKYMLENHDEIFGKSCVLPVKFDITNWAEVHEESVKKEFPCKTTACALGSAGLYPEFRKMGLKTNLESGHVKYKDIGHFSAGAEFFGIDFSESQFLFDPDEYTFEDSQDITEEYYRITRKKALVDYYNVTPKHVAQRVDYLIYKYSYEPA